MRTHADSGNADQQRQEDRKDRQPFFPELHPQAAIGGDSIGRVSAGKRKSLGRDIHFILVRLHLAQDMNAFMIEIGAAPQKNILDHRIPDKAHKHIEADAFPDALIPAPVQIAQKQDQQQFLSKRGTEGNNAQACAAQMVLNPLHQADFPGKKECASG